MRVAGKTHCQPQSSLAERARESRVLALEFRRRAVDPREHRRAVDLVNLADVNDDVAAAAERYLTVHGDDAQ